LSEVATKLHVPVAHIPEDWIESSQGSISKGQNLCAEVLGSSPQKLIVGQ
jgi:hypothetical protein